MGQEEIKIIKGTVVTPFPQTGEEERPVPIHQPGLLRKRGRLGSVKPDGSISLPTPPEPPTPAA